MSNLDGGLQAVRALAFAAALTAAGCLSACAANRSPAGSDARSHAGRVFVLAAIDTAKVSVDQEEDVLYAFPDDGGALSPARILAARFQDRFFRALTRGLAPSGLRVLVASESVLVASESAPPASGSVAAADSLAAAKPDFTLRFESLEARRTATSALMPKIGTLTEHPLFLRGDWVIRDEQAGREAARGRLRVLVTHSRKPDEKAWRKAFDLAAAQVAETSPFKQD